MPSPDTVQYCQRREVRRRILDGEPRIDGRDARTVRPIDTEVDLLPGAHGSAMFTRGETQGDCYRPRSGGTRDAQIVDSLEGREDDPFMLHYNFPPYSVGESRRLLPPSRREIGHGRLARRALTALLPSQQDFPYTLRIVSEITESQWLQLDGHGLCQQPCADGRRRAAGRPGGWHRHGFWSAMARVRRC